MLPTSCQTPDLTKGCHNLLSESLEWTCMDLNGTCEALGSRASGANLVHVPLRPLGDLLGFRGGVRLTRRPQSWAQAQDCTGVQGPGSSAHEVKSPLANQPCLTPLMDSSEPPTGQHGPPSRTTGPKRSRSGSALRLLGSTELVAQRRPVARPLSASCGASPAPGISDRKSSSAGFQCSKLMTCPHPTLRTLSKARRDSRHRLLSLGHLAHVTR